MLAGDAHLSPHFACHLQSSVQFVYLFLPYHDSALLISSIPRTVSGYGHEIYSVVPSNFIAFDGVGQLVATPDYDGVVGFGV